jgi:hypothetical protein
VATCQRIPKYWMAEFLVTSDTSAMPLTQAMVDLMDANSVHNIPRVFYMMTQTSPSTPLPKKLRESKALCAKTFKARLAQLRNPLCEWAHQYVSSTGAVNWAEGGCYRLTWEGEGKDCRATQVSYLCGNHTAKVTVEITKDFELHDPWDSLKARAEKKPARYFLHEFFKDDEGPNATKDALANYTYLLCSVGHGMQTTCEQLFPFRPSMQTRQSEEWWFTHWATVLS